MKDNQDMQGIIKGVKEDIGQINEITEGILKGYNAIESLIAKEIENKETENKNILDEVITFAEAAELMKVTQAHLTYLVKTKKLIEGKDFRRAGRIYLITKSTALRFLKDKYKEKN